MDVSLSGNYANGSSVLNATSGLQEQNQRFEKNVEELASSSNTENRDSYSQDKALIEQQEIINNFKSNARALEAVNQNIGTIIDIEV